MASDGIFMIRDGQLAVLRDAPYLSEDVLQAALANFPEVLAGGVTTDDEDRQLLLVRREKGVPTTELGSATFSLDHLFVDPDGVPVIVEVKRSSDTRLRREVVGQMLDYAANGAKYWQASDLRNDFEKTCVDRNTTPDEMIDSIAPGRTPEEFWELVDYNLRAGRVRMVFVADKLPDELVRIIEFLNEQMSPAEVLGVEVRQFTDGQTQVMVPRLVGATSAAKVTKSRSTGMKWNETTFLAEASERCTEHELSLVQLILRHGAQSGTKLSFGNGVTAGVAGWYQVSELERPVWTLNVGNGVGSSKPRLELWFPKLAAALPAPRFEAFVSRVRLVEPFRKEIDAGRHKSPICPLADLTTEEFRSILSAFESIVVPPAGAVTGSTQTL